MDPTTLPAAVLRLGAGKSAAAGATVFEMLRIGLITTGSSIRTTPPSWHRRTDPRARYRS
jgi:hypothetical protein